MLESAGTARRFGTAITDSVFGDLVTPVQQPAVGPVPRLTAPVGDPLPLPPAVMSRGAEEIAERPGFPMAGLLDSLLCGAKR